MLYLLDYYINLWSDFNLIIKDVLTYSIYMNIENAVLYM